MTSPAFILRVAAPADEAAATALITACYENLMSADYAPDVLAVALPLITYANPALLTSGTYYVAETKDGGLIGCGGWTAERPGTGDVEPGLGHIRHFATHPDFIRMGVARQIIERCKTDARARDITTFECYSSLTAESFYRACGFESIGPIDIPITETCLFPSVHMRCDF